MLELQLWVGLALGLIFIIFHKGKLERFFAKQAITYLKQLAPNGNQSHKADAIMANWFKFFYDLTLFLPAENIFDLDNGVTI